MAVNDLWEITIRGSVVGQPVFNVFHYITFSEAGGAPTQAQILTAFSNKIQASLTPCCSSVYTIVEYACQLRYAAGALFTAPRGRLQVLGSNTPGAGTAVTPSPQCAAYIRLYAEQSPSVYLRGGKFIGGLATGVVANGLITSGGLGVLNTLAGKMTENLAMGTGSATILKPVVYSPKRHAISSTPYVLPVTSTVVASSVKTLRRRAYGTPVGGYF